MKPYLYIKRILDLLFSFLILIITFPIMVCAAIAIRRESLGPILFRQPRPGKNGKIFTVYKFRTMRVELERDGVKLSDMERMTKIGAFLRKTSIDELPQLFNVIKGEMSFIGPRPLLVQYLQHYTPEQMRRHEVTPGISGWAQVNGRNAISWDEKFRLDLWYVNNIGFRVDLKILYLTLWKVVARKDINSSQNVTMGRFTGKNVPFVGSDK